MQIRFCGLHDSSYNELISDPKVRLLPGKKVITDEEGRWKVLTLERTISFGRAFFLALKVIALAIISFGTLLAFQWVRRDLVSAFSRIETIEAHIPKKPQANPRFEVNQENSYAKHVSESMQAFRKQVFKDTSLAFEHGYLLNGKKIAIDNEPMLQGTQKYAALEMLPPLTENNLYNTQFSVVQDDTFNVLLKLKAEGENPVGINMAHAYKRGGGVDEGCPAQEEALSRRSNYMKIRDLPDAHGDLGAGGIYSPHVLVFREDESKNLAFMEKPEGVALAAVAAYDFRENSQDRNSLGLPPRGELEAGALLKNEAYVEGTKVRIRTTLRAMAIHGHTAIVLGALGCGAFQNPPEAVNELFGQVFLEDEFYGRFEKVVFAILRQYPSDQANIEAFQTLCENLMA